MNGRTIVLILSALLVGAVGLTFIARVFAQPMGQMPMMPMMGQMPMNQPMSSQQMNQMMQQMQRQMQQMEATIRALRAQLDKVNPDLLTGQERPLYEYLRMLQAHLETMPPMMRNMQGMMQMMTTMQGMMMQMPAGR